MDFVRKFNAIAQSVPNIIDHVTFSPIDFDDVEINVFVSFDCEDEDELDDVIQAFIDTTCTEIATVLDSPFQVKIQVHLPGGISEDSMYDLGDNMTIAHNPYTGKIDVTILRVATNRTVTYSY